jgi:hypothetical protein
LILHVPGLLHGVVFFFAGAGVFFLGFRLLSLRRKIMGLATSKIRSLAMGVVEICGTAQLDKIELRDPIFMEPCAYYKIEVEEYRSSGKSSSWRTVYRTDSNGRAFFCRDATGQVLIVPDKPQVEIVPLTRESSVFGTNDEDPAARFLRVHASGTCRLKAHILRQGDPLYILGYAQPIPRSMSGVSVNEAAFKLKKDKERMAALDKNKDGQVDEQEWKDGLEDYKQTLDDAELKKAPPETEMQTCFLSKGPSVPLVIGNCEGDVTTNLGRGAALMVFIGAVFMIVAFFILFH